MTTPVSGSGTSGASYSPPVSDANEAQSGAPVLTEERVKALEQKIAEFYLWASVQADATVKKDLKELEELNRKLQLAGDLQGVLTRLLTQAGGSGNTDRTKFNKALDAKDEKGNPLFDLEEINKMIQDLGLEDPLVMVESKTSVAYWQEPQPTDQALMESALRETLLNGPGREAVWAQELGSKWRDGAIKTTTVYYNGAVFDNPYADADQELTYVDTYVPSEAQMKTLVANLLNKQSLTSGINPNGDSNFDSVAAWEAAKVAGKNNDTDLYSYKSFEQAYKSQLAGTVAERSQYEVKGGVIRNMTGSDLSNAIERLKARITTMTNNLQTLTSDTSQDMSLRSSINDGAKGQFDKMNQVKGETARNF